MSQDPNILNLIYDAIDEVNQQLPPAQQLAKSADTVLFGKAAQLDSLGLVNLVVAIEQRLGDEFGVAVMLANEKAFSQKSSPFRTVGSLAEYVTVLLKEQKP
jgi:acyl carrier protein